MKAIEQNFLSVLFFRLYKVVQTFESVDRMLTCLTLPETVPIGQKKRQQLTSALPRIPCSYWIGFGRGGVVIASPAGGGWKPGMLRANSS